MGTGFTAIFEEVLQTRMVTGFFEIIKKTRSTGTIFASSAIFVLAIFSSGHLSILKARPQERADALSNGSFMSAGRSGSWLMSPAPDRMAGTTSNYPKLMAKPFDEP